MKKKLFIALTLSLSTVLSGCTAEAVDRLVAALDEETPAATSETSAETEAASETGGSEAIPTEGTEMTEDSVPTEFVPTETEETGAPVTDPAADSAELQNFIYEQMYTLQTMVETYAVDWGGVYPESYENLYYEANNEAAPYFKSLVNPITGDSWDSANPGAAGILNDALNICAQPGSMVLGISEDRLTYRIGGCDQNGELMELSLSNA